MTALGDPAYSFQTAINPGDTAFNQLLGTSKSGTIRPIAEIASDLPIYSAITNNRRS